MCFNNIIKYINRRKKEQEKDPGHWDVFKLIRDAVKIPVIANGDIFNYDDMEKIKKMSSKYIQLFNIYIRIFITVYILL